jgi:hypothetical protein
MFELEAMIFERGLLVCNGPLSSLDGTTMDYTTVVQTMRQRFSAELVMIQTKPRGLPSMMNGASPLALMSRSGDRLSPSYFNDISPKLSNALLFSEVQFQLFGTLHFCEALAMRYANWCAGMCGFVHPFGDQISFTGQPSFYYDFEALITKARRTLDKLAHAVWSFYLAGGLGAQRPDNYSETVSHKKLIKAAPESLITKMSAYWASTGEAIKGYRDQVHHFATLNRFPDVLMTAIDQHHCSLQVFIPDRPEQSTAKLTYTEQRDALTYAWHVSDSLVTFIGEVMCELVPGFVVTL